MRRAALPLAVLWLLSVAGPGLAQDFLSGSGPKKPVRIDQRLNHQIPLDLVFRNEIGREVRLGDYFTGKPVILTLVYYRCPMLCNMVLDGLTNSIANIKFNIGEEYSVLTVSFDPRETPADALKKKRIYTRRYGREGAEGGWHFLTGDVGPIRELTTAAGFKYEFDPKIGQFAHGATIVVLTPEGKIARYFYGIDYPARDLRLGLVEASQNKIGSMTDQLLLMCYHYDPATGRYSRVAMNFVRAGGVVTLVGLAGFVGLMVRRDRERNRKRGEEETS